MAGHLVSIFLILCNLLVSEGYFGLVLDLIKLDRNSCPMKRVKCNDIYFQIIMPSNINVLNYQKLNGHLNWTASPDKRIVTTTNFKDVADEQVISESIIVWFEEYPIDASYTIIIFHKDLQKGDVLLTVYTETISFDTELYIVRDYHPPAHWDLTYRTEMNCKSQEEIVKIDFLNGRANKWRCSVKSGRG